MYRTIMFQDLHFGHFQLGVTSDVALALLAAFACRIRNLLRAASMACGLRTFDLASVIKGVTAWPTELLAPAAAARCCCLSVSRNNR